jgi:hypothetical protein
MYDRCPLELKEKSSSPHEIRESGRQKRLGEGEHNQREL